MSKITILPSAPIVLCAEGILLRPGEYELLLPDHLSGLGLTEQWMQDFFWTLLGSKGDTLYVSLAIQHDRSAGHWFFLFGRVPFRRVFRTSGGSFRDTMGSRIGYAASWPSEVMSSETAANGVLAMLRRE